jgi:hypothetical protein
MFGGYIYIQYYKYMSLVLDMLLSAPALCTE